MSVNSKRLINHSRIAVLLAKTLKILSFARILESFTCVASTYTILALVGYGRLSQ
jgi:hypothetical protein